LLLPWPTCEGQRKIYRPSERTVHAMKHNLRISVSKEPQTGGIVQCRKITLREKLLTKLLGQKQQVMILVPGKSVSTVSITEIPEGGVAVEQG